MTPSSGSVNLPERLTELRDTLMLTIFLKDTDKQPDEEIHKAKSGRSQSVGASVLTELGYINHLPGVDVFAHLQALRIPYYWDFVEASWHRCDQLLAQFSAPLLSLEEWEGDVTENSKLLTVAWSFW